MMEKKRRKRKESTFYNYIDITGRTFGRLTAIAAFCRLPKKYADIIWMCGCECGGYTETSSSGLLQGKTQSCGCYKLDFHAERLTRHGKSHAKSFNRLYSCWKNARTRCNNPKSPSYKHYGARGIRMLFDDFNEYESHLLEVCPNLYELIDKGYQIDRTNNEGNYEVGNLRVVTAEENNNNRSNKRIIEVFGETLSYSQAMRHPLCIIDEDMIGVRIKKGWAPAEAFCLPRLPSGANAGYRKWHKKNFPNDITLEEALAPVYLNNPGYGPLGS